ncbi:helix-turn-helix domain-containing protein [Listeria booriae]|uniref:helix-turn-helix domain-containing protein n=1 Tax=Listeria booriae TaxID=1552123 RepID=UPI001627B6D7|nr:helix-turn-helix domain-containing protein [Listeria booriae]MBC2195358.1 hypothetical protein [Listeria booriae]
MGVIKKLLLLEKKTDTLIALFNTLHETSDFIKIKNIADEYNMMIPTIQRHLLVLENSLPEGFYLEQISYRGIRLVRPNDKSVNGVEYSLIKDTLTFKLLAIAFEEKYEKISAVAEAFYISQPALYKKVHAINASFTNFKVTISTNPFCLEGEEYDIRNFYFQLINEVNSNTKEIPGLSTIIEELLANLERSLGDKITTKTQQQIARLVQISILRMKNKNAINYDLLNEVVNPQISASIFGMIKDIRDQLGIEVPKGEYNWLTHVINQQLESQVKPILNNNYIYAINALSEFVTLIEKIINKNLKKDKEFLTLLHTQLVSQNGNNEDWIDYLNYEDGKLYRELQERYPHDFNKIQFTYDTFSKANPLYRINTRKNIMDMLLFLITRKKKKKKIAIITDKSPLWESFIQISLEEFLSNEFELVPMSSQLEEVTKENFCLVISDSEMPIKDVPLMIIGDILKEQDICKINERLSDLDVDIRYII